MDILDAFLTPANLGILIASGGILAAIRQSFPAIDQHRWWARIQPVAPLMLCVGLIFIPGASDIPRWGGKLVLGLAIGAFSTVGYKTIRQSLFGHDERITDKPTPPPTNIGVAP
jgi:hypothetical protein